MVCKFTSRRESDWYLFNIIFCMTLLSFIFSFFFLILVVLEEIKQNDSNDKLSSLFNEISSAENFSFNVTFVQLDRDQLKDGLSHCKRLNVCSRFIMQLL